MYIVLVTRLRPRVSFNALKGSMLMSKTELVIREELREVRDWLLCGVLVAVAASVVVALLRLASV